MAGAGLDQFTAVADEAAQLIERPVAARWGQVVVAGADAGNHQGVDAIGFGVRALASAGLAVICGGTSTTSTPAANRASAAGRP